MILFPYKMYRATYRKFSLFIFLAGLILIAFAVVDEVISYGKSHEEQNHWKAHQDSKSDDNVDYGGSIDSLQYSLGLFSTQFSNHLYL